MNDLNDTLPDLFRRATEDLRPESADLGERGLRRGIALRRRRTVLRSLAAAGAAVATVSVAIGGVQVIRGDSITDASVAGTPSLTASVTSTPAATSSTARATPKETLQILESLLPGDLRVSKPRMWGDNFIAVSLVVDDGKDASHIEVSVQTAKDGMTCATEPPTTHCRVRPDGSIITAYQTRPMASDDDVILNSVIVHRPDRKVIHLSSANAPAAKTARHTRAQPVFSIAELTRMADSKLWEFPPASYGRDLGR